MSKIKTLRRSNGYKMEIRIKFLQRVLEKSGK